MRLFHFFACVLLSQSGIAFALAESASIVRVDHFVNVKSASAAIQHQNIQLYLREVKAVNTQPTGAVLFIHGSGTPSDVSFDIPYKDYSWMAYLAQEGFDVYGLDLTGYGRSTRPAAMNDPCNLSASEQQQFIPSLLKKTCAKNHSQALTTIESDWADIDAAVNFIHAQKRIISLALIGWSQGGPRNLGYIQRHPGKIDSLVLLAPAYHRDAPLKPPSSTDLKELMSVQNQTEFTMGWAKQIGCADQVDFPIREVIWREMLASDALGKTWGSGVRRAPEQGETWGFNQATAEKFTLPTLLVAGEFDIQVSPATVRKLFADLGSPKKVFIDLACSSHRASWETNHLLLFKASADWIKNNAIGTLTRGEIKLGYKTTGSSKQAIK